MKAFEVLLNLLISIINALNENGFRIYDADNRDYYISNIEYCGEDDRLIFNCKEDKNGKGNSKA